MRKEKIVEVRTVRNCAIGFFRDPHKADLLVLTLKAGKKDGTFEDLLFALDQRVAEHLWRGVSKSVKKLREPGHIH